MGFGVERFRFGVEVLGSWLSGVGSRVRSWGFGMWDLEFRGYGLGCRVQDSGFRVYGVGFGDRVECSG